MKALVTGGSGFLGHHLVKELVRQGIETVIYDFTGPSKYDNTLHQRKEAVPVTHIQGDILDMDALTAAMIGCDMVFHTAAIADIDEARHIPVKTMEVNVLGTVKCLEAARKSSVKRFSMQVPCTLPGTGVHFTGYQSRRGSPCVRHFLKNTG